MALVYTKLTTSSKSPDDGIMDLREIHSSTLPESTPHFTVEDPAPPDAEEAVEPEARSMPLGVKPECVKCGGQETPLWHATDLGSVCNRCLESERSRPPEEEAPAPGRPARKSTRVTRYNGKPGKPGAPATGKGLPKGKGRRHIFKKTPMKSPAATATPVTSSYVFYKGSYFQVGDIVSMQDIDGGIYYAQIRGLLTDQYCEKSAAVTWLLPTTASPPPEDGFIPETYIIGPEEDLPRKLEYMEFVMHAPSDYYKLKNSPYPPILAEGGSGYIWTSLRNEASLKK